MNAPVPRILIESTWRGRVFGAQWRPAIGGSLDPAAVLAAVGRSAREILDAFKERDVDEITLVFGSQAGKSSILMTGAAWTLIHAAMPILWVMPSEHLARSFSKGRWQPLVQESPAMRSQLPTRKQDFTNLEQHFQRCVLNFVGSNSPANISSRPVGLLIADEVDKFAAASSREASALELAELRVKGYSGAKIVRASTPTTTEGEIWQRYLRGDQRRFFVPCLKCGTDQVLEWKGITWDPAAKDDRGQWNMPRVRASTRYKCRECGTLFDDGAKFRMIRQGQWRPTNLNALGGERSYQLSSLYSPDRKCTLGVLAVKFLQATKSLLGLQSFVNGDLAEPWMDQRLNRTERVELVSPPDAGPLPEAACFLTVDVQAVTPLFWFIVREWSKGGDSRLVAAGHCDSWEALARIQSACSVPDHRVLVDSGFRAGIVYEQCLRHARPVPRPGNVPLSVGWTPCKGRDGKFVWTNKVDRRPVPFFYARAALPPSVRIELPLLEHNGEALRDQLDRMRKNPQAAGVAWAVTKFPCGPEIHGVSLVDEDVYWSHLDSWHVQSLASAKTGRTELQWMARTYGVSDHLLDCELLQVLAAMAHKRLGIPETTPPVPADTALPVEPRAVIEVT
jgi:hypothetical protein